MIPVLPATFHSVSTGSRRITNTLFSLVILSPFKPLSASCAQYTSQYEGTTPFKYVYVCNKAPKGKLINYLSCNQRKSNKFEG